MYSDQKDFQKVPTLKLWYFGDEFDKENYVIWQYSERQNSDCQVKILIEILSIDFYLVKLIRIWILLHIFVCIMLFSHQTYCWLFTIEHTLYKL